jgi:hypothetical protein
MRTPLEVVLGDHPYVRLGVNPTSGSDAPTKVELKYKAGTDSWETLTMELEPPGDGWQAKYDGNDYYASFIPADKFEAGMTVQYYFYLEYANSSLFAVTSVGTTDQRGSIAYLGPNEAKAHPFEFTVGEASHEPTLILDREGLAAIADNLAGTYELGADIDLGGTDWTPLGNDSTPFTGSFNGNGHTISGLVCTNNPSSNSCRGLFGCASNAKIKCVSVSGIVAGNESVGGLVGNVKAGTVVSNCVASVEVSGMHKYAGGLVGSCLDDSADSLIVDCRADGFVNGNGYVGGFIGYVYDPVTITNCVARGDVRSAGSDFGGFIGRLADASAKIDGCWCSGAVWGTGGNIGAFIGDLQSGTIANCAASAYANGPRLFCGGSTAITGGVLSLSDVHARSAGWPSVPKRSKSSAMIPVSTAEELRAVTNNLAGSYVLTADIDLNGEGWTPIGNQDAAFTGEFYGQGHRITGFKVVSDDRYAGLFGKISGGRVSGVAAEGKVIGDPTVSGAVSDVGVGGFAGKIDSKALVEGCSFDGEVENTATYNAGGFVGYTTDSPVILRCRAWGTVVHSLGESGTGGFVGNHRGGSIADCSALMGCTATDNGNAKAGGFAGIVESSARIANSWCSGEVDSRASYVGAFVGNANGTGLITNSYYDTAANSTMGAAGKSGGSTAYAGITPIDLDGKYCAASYPSFDFTNTWRIAEGTDEPRLVPLNGFTTFLDDCYLPLGTDPYADVNGIQAGARYVFGIDPSTAPSNLSEPLIDIKFDTDGKPYVKLPSQVNTDGAEVTVLATEDLADWDHAIECTVNPATGSCLVPLDTVPPHLFFMYRIDIVY